MDVIHFVEDEKDEIEVGGRETSRFPFSFFSRRDSRSRMPFLSSFFLSRSLSRVQCQVHRSTFVLRVLTHSTLLPLRP